MTVRTITLYGGMLGAAKYLHNLLLDSILHWPISTFDRIPCGRILNRFAFDIDVLDNALPRNMVNAIMYSTLVRKHIIFTFVTRMAVSGSSQ